MMKVHYLVLASLLALDPASVKADTTTGTATSTSTNSEAGPPKEALKPGAPALTAKSATLPLRYQANQGRGDSNLAATYGVSGLQFIPVTPCRVADTRNPTGPFGGPELGAGTSREFDIPQSACGIPSTAVAYSLNVTVVPNASLNYLTIWPTGESQPYVSTLNSDGRIKANAAIVPAGTNGGVSIFVTDPTQVILDIDGYFVPASTTSALAFYPLSPCRIADTRGPGGPLGGPFLSANTSRAFPVLSSSCGILPTAEAYSLNVTAVPHKTLNYLTIWPTGEAQPYVSTLNSSTGAVTANAAIVPADTSGEVSVYVYDDADVILDINGYFAPPGTGGLSLYALTPCRVIDTRPNAFSGTLVVNVEGSACAPPSTAQAYVFNATVVPPGPLSYLTLWPDEQTQPYVSTLNADDGAITSNMAIVPTGNGKVDAYAYNPTNLILDLSSYFAPASGGAAINSFTANPTQIEAGSSSNLTANFSGGTGAIMPGNLLATSGTPVSVSPAATTTYTLTVTPTAGGTPVSQTTTVTVYPQPSITSFTANPTTLAAGNPTSLTANFSGGTAVVTPGNIAITSEKPVTLYPNLTTTYTLTVTPTIGKALTQTMTVTVQTAVNVDLQSTGPAVTDQLLGMNMAVWYDLVTYKAAILDGFQTAGITAVRWPGGSDSDLYHWATNTLCDGGYTDTNDTFSNFVNDLAIPAKLDVALTANYGSNTACSGGGEPSEAAAWVAQALTDGITVSHMTVGNEVYGNWEYDLHSTPNDPTIYAAAVVGSNGYYQSIKAASPHTLVGIVVDADNTDGGWDNTVLANAKGSYDFVEFHYYPQGPGQESDSFLVNQAAPGLTNFLNIVKAELNKWGTPGTPIYVGEMGSVYTNPGKQSMSITQALFAGQMLAEMMNDGVSRATWWIGFGGCEDSASGTGANFSSSLYGWQDFGGYMVFSDGLPDGYECEHETLAAGTLLPTARAYQLFSSVAVNGESVLTATVTGDTTNVRAYAATHSGGTALVLFNLNENASTPAVISLSGQSSSSSVTVETYDKALYDESNPTYNNGNPVWTGPTTTSMGGQTLPLTLTLTRWSINVVLIK
jgi:hypothetical protein